ncbi:hypothetical protein GQ457_02G002570 [Hibiscus cannabinus]
MNRRRGASEMVDLVNFQQQRLHDVVSDELEVRVSEMVHDVLFSAGEEVVDDDHAVSPRYQPVHQVRPDEPGSTRHDDSQTFPFQPQGNLARRVERPET